VTILKGLRSSTDNCSCVHKNLLTDRRMDSLRQNIIWTFERIKIHLKKF